MKQEIQYTVTEHTQFAVLGLGKFGRSVVKALIDNNYDVFCCDTNEKIVSEAAHYVEHIVQADATSDDFLLKFGIANFDIVIIGFSRNFEDTVLTTLKLKEHGVPMVIVKATDERHKRVLEKIGADYVILPEIVMGERLVQSLIHNDPLMHIRESSYFEIVEIEARAKWVNKSLKDLQLTKTERINVIGIVRESKLIDSITSETVIRENDTLIVIRTIG